MPPLPLSKSIPPAIVLVRPQLSENIGAAARAMANFGASDLRLVNPRSYDPVLAGRMACDGRSILERAQIFADLRTAVADCVYTIATSRRLRRVKLPALTPEEAGSTLRSLAGSLPTALVFGSEQAGLTNEELFLCDAASTIQTTDQGSLNLGQAVLLYIYAWFNQSAPKKPTDPRNRLATHEEKQRVYDVLETLLKAGDYKPLSRLPEFQRRVKLLFESRPLTQREQRILLKMLRTLERLPVKSKREKKNLTTSGCA